MHVLCQITLCKFSQVYQELPVEIFQYNWKFPSRKLLLHHSVVKVPGSSLSHLVLSWFIVSNQFIISSVKIIRSEVSGTPREVNLHKSQCIVQTYTQFWHLKGCQVSGAQWTRLFSTIQGISKMILQDHIILTYICLKNGSSTEENMANS